MLLYPNPGSTPNAAFTAVAFHPGESELIMGSYKLLHNSNSIDRGHYLSGIIFDCEKIPANGVNETVLASSG